MKYKLCAITLKEIVSLSYASQASQKKLMTELIKSLKTLTPCDQWLRHEPTGRIILKILEAISQQYSMDRISKRLLNDFLKSCQETEYDDR
jgi:hypothetical protein